MAGYIQTFDWMDTFHGCQATWHDVCKCPLDQVAVTATLSALYQKAGYTAPKVVFLDSYWATAIAPYVVFQKPAAELKTQVHTDLLNVRQELSNQLFEQLWNQCHDDKASESARALFYDSDWQMLSPDFAHYPARIDAPNLVNVNWSENPWVSCYRHYSEHNQTHPNIEHIYQRLCDRLFAQLGLEINRFPQQDIDVVAPIWYGPTLNSVFYEYATEYIWFGITLDAELFELFLSFSLYNLVFNPFPGICFVSDRPQIKRDHLGRLHAEAEPAIQFSDGSGEYFHHGSRLPPTYGSVSPSQ
jgi:hypothetical protein